MILIGASLSKPHTSVTALCMCVCMYVCLSVCLFVAMYLGNKRAYKHTACCNMVSIWTHTSLWVCLVHEQNSRVAKPSPVPFVDKTFTYWIGTSSTKLLISVESNNETLFITRQTEGPWDDICLVSHTTTYICDEPKFTFFLTLTAHCAPLMTHSQNASSKQNQKPICNTWIQ